MLRNNDFPLDNDEIALQTFTATDAPKHLLAHASIGAALESKIGSFKNRRRGEAIMQDQGMLNCTASRWVLGAVCCLALSVAGSRIAGAQEIEPNDFVPAPDGTNIMLGYYVYGHKGDYNVAKGSTINNSGLEVNLGLARYVHYNYIAGFPAGVQIIQGFGSESGGHIGNTSAGGTRLGSSFGAANTTLSAFIWPYSSIEKKQYFIVAGFLNPPDGQYNKNSGINVGSPSWSGEIQFGWDQGIGEHFSYDLGFDVIKAGDYTAPVGRRSSTDPAFRLQGFANWNWTSAFQTSIGWESILGGTGYTNNARNGTKAEFERLRVVASDFVLPNTQVLVELNRDFVAVGGFKQAFGATARVAFIF